MSAGSAPRAPRSAPDPRGQVAALVGSLDARDRLVLALCLVEGLSALEAGATLRMPSREVERRLAVLRAKLSRRAGVRRGRRSATGRAA
jgi:DNA-directed RNA polymerase specialized sigma24 family protein